MAPRDLKVLLVDDQSLIRAGLRRLIELDPSLAVSGECTDGSEVLNAVTAQRPDVILMDIRMKYVDGDVATRLLAQSMTCPPPVLALTAFDSADTIAAALSAGAQGFILKEAPGEDLIRASKRVAMGDCWLDPTALREVMQIYRTTGLATLQQTQRFEQLTGRENDVLHLVARGATNAEVADSLTIGESTVKTHLHHMLTKLGLRDRAAAIVFAFDHGLVIPASPPKRGADEGQRSAQA
ncbi:MAG: response regulator transcription factor [Aquihabitans sp.]